MAGGKRKGFLSLLGRFPEDTGWFRDVELLFFTLLDKEDKNRGEDKKAWTGRRGRKEERWKRRTVRWKKNLGYFGKYYIQC